MRWLLIAIFKILFQRNQVRDESHSKLLADHQELKGCYEDLVLKLGNLHIYLTVSKNVIQSVENEIQKDPQKYAKISLAIREGMSLGQLEADNIGENFDPSHEETTEGTSIKTRFKRNNDGELQ